MRSLMVCLAALVLVQAEDGRAQEVVSLEEVQELASAGRTEEARTALMAWWEDQQADASRRDVQRALWLRGILTVDPQQAAMDFRRLLLEYPGGPFSDRALFRLAQNAWEAGYPREADTYMATLLRDYPSSPVRQEAVEWMNAARQRGAMGEPAATDSATVPAAGEPGAAERVPPGEAEPVSPTEAEALVAAEAEGVEEEAAPPAEALPTRFGVQLGAFSGEDRARMLQRRAADAGLEARLVRLESTGLLHVRVGAYDSIEEATALLRRVTGMGFVAALVRDVNDEREIGR